MFQITAGLIFFLITAGHAQKVRTFNHLELGTAFAKNTHQYHLFWGESVAFKSVRFITGIRGSLTQKSAALYPPSAGTLPNDLLLNKRAAYTSFAIPVGIEFFVKGLGIGAYQEVFSFTGNKKLDNTFTPLDSSETLRLQRFSGIFGTKQNLTGGAYLIYTFNDSFSLKAGWNRINSTFIKENATQQLGYARLSDDTFTLGIRLNIEK